MEKSKILVIGATGRLGYLLTKASLEFSHPTFALVRESAFSDPIKSQKLQSLSDSGATILKGSLQDEASLLEAVKQVDVVICAVSAKQILDQKLLIQVIKQVGSTKFIATADELAELVREDNIVPYQLGFDSSREYFGNKILHALGRNGGMWPEDLLGMI